ncbi:EsaB/YukD family protein [Tumebacillus sp. DT12]|uniref:EsaB/YukD family protein n=1 Tax=Tumebacillus lacus TaxID=2995335 RepID=A0ABT3X6N4_9BACL|nr:EsaB/YukD family protein [Tumebacillus lacus]MCX7572111.1 EsaB/YukD family protein [Tumebacillus lacus]
MTMLKEQSAPPLLVTIEGLYGAVDVEIPGDVALDTLLPHLLQHPAFTRQSDPSDPHRWTFGIKGGQRFDLNNTLYNYGVLEGMVLQLQPSDRYTDPEPEIEQELSLPNDNRLLVIDKVSNSFTSMFKKKKK